jgi:hypothetical protein
MRQKNVCASCPRSEKNKDYLFIAVGAHQPSHFPDVFFFSTKERAAAVFSLRLMLLLPAYQSPQHLARFSSVFYKPS